MAMDRSARARRCVNCGNDVPLRKGRRPTTCPTCGARQEFDEDRLARRPGSGFRIAYLIAGIVGGVAGLAFGPFFAWMIYTRDTAPPRLYLLMAAYALAAAGLGSIFAIMSVVLWTRER